MQAAQYCEKQREECLVNKQSLIFETVLSSEGKVDFIRRAHVDLNRHLWEIP